MRELPLTQGFVAIVDDDVYEWASLRRWQIKRAVNTNYAWQIHPRVARGETGFLHRLILGLSDRRVKVDHVNHNGLDCRRENIRACTQGQNLGNQRKVRPNTSSRFKGVSIHRKSGRWQVTIMVKQRAIFLGKFATPEEGAHAYDERAREVYGEFACVNFPRPGERSALAS